MPAIDTIKGFIGDVARPFALVSVAVATSACIWGNATSDKVGAAGLILVALYGARSYENIQTKKQDASVQIAQANASGA